MNKLLSCPVPSESDLELRQLVTQKRPFEGIRIQPTDLCLGKAQPA